jgi:hypothetical protein
VAIKISFNDTNSPTGRSARYFSGAIYNKHTVLSAAHGFLGYEGLTAEVRTGPNFRTNTGTIHKVKSIKLNPDFSRLGRAGTHDSAILQLETPIADTLPATLSTNRPAVGSTVTLSGFGFSGTPSSGLGERQDGFARAGTSVVDTDLSATISGQSSEYYVGTIFRRTGFPGDLRGAPGDSGGPVFVLDQQGRVVSLAGLMVSTSIPLGGVFTYFLDLTHPTVRKFIEDNAWSPEPELPNLSIVQRDGGLLLSWAETPNVVLQQGPSSQGPWKICTDTPTSQNGTSSVFLYSENLGEAGFFRLNGNP